MPSKREQKRGEGRGERVTSARMQAVTPVPHEVTTGLSKEMPAQKE